MGNGPQGIHSISRATASANAITAMRQEFQAVMKAEAQLKDTELHIDAFAQLGSNGNLRRMTDALKGALHSKYVLSLQKQPPSPAHTNLS